MSSELPAYQYPAIRADLETNDTLTALFRNNKGLASKDPVINVVVNEARQTIAEGHTRQVDVNGFIQLGQPVGTP